MLFCILLLIKFATVTLLSTSRKCHDDQNLDTLWAVNSGDTPSYIEAMENFIVKGEYYWFNGHEKVRASRLPHFAIPYFLFRQFANEEVSKDLLVLFQIIIECIAILLISVIIGELTGLRIYFYLSAFIFSISLRWTNYANYLGPESLGISLLIIGLFYFHRFRHSKSTIHLLMTGTMIGLGGIMKPYMLVMFMPIGIYFIQEASLARNGIKKIIEKTLLISIPLILLLTPWIIRNYGIYDRFVPLQINTKAGYKYSASDMAVRRYVKSWGGNFIFWDPNSAGCFFDARKGFPCNFVIPDRLVTKNVSKEDIISARDKFIEAKGLKDNAKEEKIVSQFNQMTQDFISENQVYYHVVAPLKLTRIFLFHSGSYYVPFTINNSCIPSYLWVIKVLQSALYYLTLIFGSTGLIVLAFRSNEYIYLFIPIFLIVFFPITLRAVEWRYFNASYPVLVLGLVYLIHLLFSEKIKKFLPKTLLNN